MCSDIDQRMENRYCSTCGKFGHNLEYDGKAFCDTHIKRRNRLVDLMLMKPLCGHCGKRGHTTDVCGGGFQNKRRLAIKNIRSWIWSGYGFGSLCNLKWRHNRQTPIFFNYPVISEPSSLEDSFDEICDNETHIKVSIIERLDFLAIHKGMPVYGFKLMNGKQTIDPVTRELYQSLTAENHRLEIYYLDVNLISRYKRKPPVLPFVDVFKSWETPSTLPAM
jgi:hypothetical protein